MLSTTVCKVLSNYGSADAAGIAKFCLIFDKSFDTMNVSSTTVLPRELKPFNALSLSTDDSRFSWLKNQLLKYFEDWFRSIDARPGVYTKSKKQKIFISSQTYKSFEKTVHSVIEVVKFFIMLKVSCVLSEKFCQDSYFGKQYSSGARKDSPSL